MGKYTTDTDERGRHRLNSPLWNPGRSGVKNDVQPLGIRFLDCIFYEVSSFERLTTVVRRSPFKVRTGVH